MEEMAGKKKKRGGKTAEMEALEELVTQHKWHITKMETVQRLLDNQELQPDDVDGIKDDIEYYIESFDDPDYYNDETMYDVLDLDSFATITSTVARG